MPAENLENTPKVRTLEKRRVKMADGQRYLIYYTFETSENALPNADESLPETKAQNSTIEEEINV